MYLPDVIKSNIDLEIIVKKIFSVFVINFLLDLQSICVERNPVLILDETMLL